MVCLSHCHSDDLCVLRGGHTLQETVVKQPLQSVPLKKPYLRNPRHWHKEGCFPTNLDTFKKVYYMIDAAKRGDLALVEDFAAMDSTLLNMRIK
jgi:hypothetical protein